MKITVLIVDDEPPARESLRQLIRRDADLELVGEAADGIEALELIRRLRPQLVFLDVQMPEMTGLELVAQLPAGWRPDIVFVTAFDRFALKAFDLEAIDYLLKPYPDERFFAAVERAKRRVQLDSLESQHAKIDRVLAALRTPPPPPAPPSHAITFRCDGELHIVVRTDIAWIEAQGDYLRVHARGGSLLVRETMRDFLERVGPGEFLRVHKSAIVNLAHVRRSVHVCAGDYELELDTGAKVRVSRLYRQDLMGRLML